MNTLRQTLEYLLQSIVDHPEMVTIEESQAGEVTLYQISAPPEMIGQIIGKEGKIIKSIRTILNLCYPDIKYNLDIKG